MNSVSGEWSVYVLIDTVSEATEIPFLLIDSQGNPLYRSRYYFQGDLSQQVAAELRRSLASAVKVETQTQLIEVKGMEAIVARVHGFLQKCYLVAGYFISPEKEEAVLKHFGPELGRELISKNLLLQWNGKLQQITGLLESLAQLFSKDHYLENIKRLSCALDSKAGLQSEKFWQDVFAVLCNGFSFLWGAVVFSGFVLVLQEDGTVRRVIPFSCPLSDWIGTIGKPTQLPDLTFDVRGARLLKLRPATRTLISLPFSLGDGNVAVLHLAAQEPLNQMDIKQLEQLQIRLEKKDHTSVASPSSPKQLESAYTTIMGLLTGNVPFQRAYSILLGVVSKVLQCHSAALYFRNNNGRFTTVDSLNMDSADLKQECVKLERVYGQKVMYPRVPPGPQGGGYCEAPIYIGNVLIGVLILRGCPETNGCEAGFIQWVTAVLAIIAEREQTQSVVEVLQSDLIEGILVMLEAHSPWLKSHAKRTAVLARALAQVAGLPEDEMQQVHTAALLHNIGKISWPWELLQASQTLTQLDSTALVRYVECGADMLSSISSLAHLSPVIAQLEENVDGSGYPAGLKESAIHVHARIIRIASIFAAMVADRPVDGELSHAEGLRKMETEVGKQISHHYFTLFKQSLVLQGPSGYSNQTVTRNRFESLTPREHEVLVQIARGKTNADIAETLYISEKTVKIHVSNLLQKIDAKDRTQAAVLYLTHKE